MAESTKFPRICFVFMLSQYLPSNYSYSYCKQYVFFCIKQVRFENLKEMNLNYLILKCADYFQHKIKIFKIIPFQTTVWSMLLFHGQISMCKYPTVHLSSCANTLMCKYPLVHISMRISPMCISPLRKSPSSPG